MSTPPANPQVPFILSLLDQAYDSPSWHGPNLKNSIRGVSPAHASWRPSPNRHNIAEIALHAAYWRYVVRRRLIDLPRGAFPRSGSNWFLVPPTLTSADWREIKSLLDDQHSQLRETVSHIPPERWQSPSAPSSPHTVAEMVQGVAFHDTYHAGQIQLLRRLLAAPS